MESTQNADHFTEDSQRNQGRSPPGVLEPIAVVGPEHPRVSAGEQGRYPMVAGKDTMCLRLSAEVTDVPAPERLADGEVTVYLDKLDLRTATPVEYFHDW